MASSELALWLFAWQRRFASSAPPLHKRQRDGSNRGGVVPFSRGHWHIFSPRGRTRPEKLNEALTLYPFFKNSVYYMFVGCDFFLFIVFDVINVLLFELFIKMHYPSCYFFYFRY